MYILYGGRHTVGRASPLDGLPSVRACFDRVAARPAIATLLESTKTILRDYIAAKSAAAAGAADRSIA